MEKHQHLKLPLFESNVERKKRGGGGGFSLPQGRNKAQFSQKARQQAENLSNVFLLSGNINSSLIFEIEVNQSVSTEGFEQTLASMGIHVLSIAEGKKGYWVVFSEDEELKQFKEKLSTYGSEKGANYDFFHAIESFDDIPVEKKIGEQLATQPLGDTADFIDLELWKMDDPQINEQFIQQLKTHYSQFRITDKLITKSFVLLRVKLNKTVFDEIIQLKEIARADKPSTVQFNPFSIMQPNVTNIEFNAPKESATGILVIDSGIVSSQLQDTVGHGTAVAGCAVYGNIEESLDKKNFSPSNIKTPIAKVHQPSPFTRTGFGINGMIKPELVEYC